MQNIILLPTYLIPREQPAYWQTPQKEYFILLSLSFIEPVRKLPLQG